MLLSGGRNPSISPVWPCDSLQSLFAREENDFTHQFIYDGPNEPPKYYALIFCFTNEMWYHYFSRYRDISVCCFAQVCPLPMRMRLTFLCGLTGISMTPAGMLEILVTFGPVCPQARIPAGRVLSRARTRHSQLVLPPLPPRYHRQCGPR